MNETIDTRAADLDTQKSAGTPWLYNDSSTIYFNESHYEIDLGSKGYVNESVSSYLNISDHKIDFNESKLLETIAANDTDTQKSAAGPYLYNDSTTIYFNETKLNETIDARDTDTQKEAAGP